MIKTDPPRAPGGIRCYCYTKESLPKQNQRNSKPAWRYNETLKKQGNIEKQENTKKNGENTKNCKR